MLFTELGISGAWLIEPEFKADERGYFARTWCREEFAAHGLTTEFVQLSVSRNTMARTLRGLHYQVLPKPEVKLVSCPRGAIFDVLIDLRPESRTYLQWTSADLSQENLRALYIPPHCAHGFVTLSADTLVSYQISEFYSPTHARGVRWNDPHFGIRWPVSPLAMSDHDRNRPNFSPETAAE